MRRRLFLPIAALTATALLLAFQTLVQQSMRQGQARQLEASRQAAAWAECSRMPDRDGRKTCRDRVLPDQDPTASGLRSP